MESSGQQQNQSNEDVLAATPAADTTANEGQQQQQQRRRPRPDQMDANSIWGSVTESQRSFKIYEAENHYFGDDVSVATSVQQPQPLASTNWMESAVNTGNDSDNDDAILDVNGNSLPHPDTMRSTKAARKKVYQDLDNILGGNGNSLPHPETLMRGSKAVASAGATGNDSGNDDAMLDVNGNSLPHPDTMRSSNIANRNESMDALDENGNSLPHPETLRGIGTDILLADLEGRAAETDSTDDSSDNSSDDDSSSDSSSNGEDCLDDNGNSLPHPDTMLASAATRQNSPSSLFGNLRRSVMSSLPGMKKRSSSGTENATSHKTDNFLDGEYAAVDVEAAAPRINTFPPHGSFTGTPSGGIFTIDDASDTSDPVADLLNLDNGNSLPPPGGILTSRARERHSALPLDENRNSLPLPEAIFSVDNGQNTSSSRWRGMGQSFLSPFNAKAPVSSLHSNAENPRAELNNFEDDPFMDTTYDEDEGNGLNVQTGSTFYGAENGGSVIPLGYEVDSFEDENRGDENVSSVSHRFNKERIQNMFQGRRFSWKWGCLIFAIFLIFLGMLIPLVMLAKERRQRIESPPPVYTTAPVSSNSPTTSPSTTSITAKIFDIYCEDEIALVDAEGNDIADENASISIFSDNSDTIACYTTKQPVLFRFKRCNPLPLDWVGIFPSGSMFMDKLWKSFYGGTYLCAGQPCPEVAGNIPITKTSTAPPITNPGVYRFFLVKYSDWPYEYATYAPSFRVVEDEQQCQIPLPTMEEETFPPSQVG